MTELAQGIYYRVVKKKAGEREVKEIFQDAKELEKLNYQSIDRPERLKMNGYFDLIKNIKVDFETENLLIFH